MIATFPSIFPLMRRKTDASLHDTQYFPLMRRESRHMYFPLLRWEYKSNIAVCCICSHCCGGNICRSTTQILQLIVKKQKFVQLLTLWVCLFLRNRGWGTRQKKLQRSSEYHERLAELDNVHNQAFANLPTPLRRPRRPPLLRGRPRRLPLLRGLRSKKLQQALLRPDRQGLELIALDHASSRNFEQATAAGKPAPGPVQGTSCTDIGTRYRIQA